MRVNADSISIHRGEAFTVDFLFVNKDESPFVVSSEITHPYARVSVVSNTFNTANQYVLNQWCDLTNFYRFVSTKPYKLTANTWASASLPASATTVGVITVNSRDIYYCKDTVFTITTTDGEDLYGVFVFDEDPSLNDDYSGEFVEYKFELAVSYDTETTSQWSSQNYAYQISIVETDAPVASGMQDEDIVVTMLIPLLANGQITVLNSVGGVN